MKYYSSLLIIIIIIIFLMVLEISLLRIGLNGLKLYLLIFNISNIK